jgi:peptidoglycan hydrolase-like protein with peptidoglycan-binding domain
MRIVSAVAVVGVAGTAGYAVVVGRSDGTGSPPVEASASTGQVRRGAVAERRWLTGSLGYSGTTDIAAPGEGVLTGVPAVGQVVGRGGAVYEVDGLPVILLYGPRPPWRPFEPGMTDGVDVEQLESNLVRLGHGSGVTVDRHFSSATSQAVRRWQRAVGLPVTGSVPLGRVVFAADAVRVSEHELAVGARVEPGAVVVHGTGAEPAVSFQLVPRQLPGTKVGDAVVVTLPDGTTREGTIVSIGAVVAPSAEDGDGGNGGGGGNQPSAPVSVRLAGAAVTGFMDRSQVQVAVTVAARADVLTVPVTALNPVPDGGYEVVVVDGATTVRVPVEVGLFDERAGLV